MCKSAKLSRSQLVELGLSTQEAISCMNLAYRNQNRVYCGSEMRRSVRDYIIPASVIDIEELAFFVQNREVSANNAKSCASMKKIVMKAYQLFKKANND